MQVQTALLKTVHAASILQLLMRVPSSDREASSLVKGRTLVDCTQTVILSRRCLPVPGFVPFSKSYPAILTALPSLHPGPLSVQPRLA